MDSFKITLPFPPSVNALFGGGSKQKRFPSKQYKAWLAACQELPPLEIDYCSIVYEFYFPDNTERDSHNYIKAVMDYLIKQKVIVNDSWKHIAHEVIMPMGIDRKDPRVEVTIKKAARNNTL